MTSQERPVVRLRKEETGYRIENLPLGESCEALRTRAELAVGIALQPSQGPRSARPTSQANPAPDWTPSHNRVRPGRAARSSRSFGAGRALLPNAAWYILNYTAPGRAAQP